MKVTSKICFFLWCTLYNSLHILQNLIRRKIDVNPLCPVCLEVNESVLHIFSTCQFARLIWAISALPAQCFTVPNSDFWNWIHAIIQGLMTHQFDYFVCVYWCLWNHRNCIVHDGKHGDPMELVLFSADYLQRFHSVHHHFAQPRPSDSSLVWFPPSGSTVKINVDASILKPQNTAGLSNCQR